jgi:hypothetical protein
MQEQRHLDALDYQFAAIDEPCSPPCERAAARRAGCHSPSRSPRQARAKAHRLDRCEGFKGKAVSKVGPRGDRGRGFRLHQIHPALAIAQILHDQTRGGT